MELPRSTKLGRWTALSISIYHHILEDPGMASLVTVRDSSQDAGSHFGPLPWDVKS